MRRFFISLLTLLSATYLIGMCSYALLRLTLGDRFWWLFILNSGGLFLFLPLLLVVPWALWRRSRWLITGGAVAAVSFALLHGQYLLPVRPAVPEGTALRVMTFNTLGPNPRTDLILQAIRDSGADVVGLQELSPRTATAIERELTAMYPHQILSPEYTVLGMGVISKLPLTLAGTLPGQQWIGAPQVVDIGVDGRTVRLINFHALAPAGMVPGSDERVRIREAQMEALVEHARAAGLPIIATGDMNAPPGSGAYRIVTQQLTDAWRAGAGGFGHTWPGATRPGTGPRVVDLPIPRYFVRIDYIFHSAQFATTGARLGPEYTGSDHRAVIADLVLRGG